jgi:DNA-binding PadR family transcriptional regulator
MGKGIRITGPTLKVIGQILTASGSGISGAEISKATGVASGTLYPILFRLEKAGWVNSEWEDGDPSEMGRPRKRLYQLTATGARESKLAFHGLVPNGRLIWESW